MKKLLCGQKALGLFGCIVLFTSTANAQLFAPAISYPIGQKSWIVAAADLDADGDIDLAVSREGGSEEGPETIVILMNDSHGVFSVDSTYNAGNDPGGIVPADLDNDGDIDLAVTDHSNHTLYVLLNNGQGVFTLDSSYASGGLNANKLCAADLDKDGDIDLVVPNSGSGNLAVFMNNGDATLASPVLYTVGTHPQTVISGDVDKDGDADLVVTINGESKVSILLNSGSGAFGLPTSYAVGTNPQSPALADFDKDGNLDLAVPNAHFSTTTVSVLKGNGNGTFQAKTDWFGSRPHTVTVADYDKDGNLDIATANNETNTVGVLLGNGDLTFKSQIEFTVGTGPNTTDAADFDGDGQIDLVAANYDNNGSPGNGVSVLINNTVLFVSDIGPSPTEFFLSANYPNPFNPSTEIRFTIPRSQFTSLKVYDGLGREVTTLVNEELRPGTYSVTWDATGFPSGVYYYRLRAGEFERTKRLVLLR